MQNDVCGKEFKRIELFHELYDKKDPVFGNFNSYYVQTKSLESSITNEKFTKKYENDTNSKLMNRYYYSKILRNSN